MAEEEMNAGITVTWRKTTDKPFEPSEPYTITAVLTPEQEEEQTFYSPEYTSEFQSWLPPWLAKYPEIPSYELAQKELVINIETTRVLPWESRLVCIGVLDPNAAAPEPMNIIADSEEEMLDTFLAFYEDSGFSEFVGYNVVFDYRYIYALCEKYRKPAPKFMEAELYDLMQQQEQVKDKFVPGYNKAGTLDNWLEYLLGWKPYAKQEQVWKWWKEKNFDEIVNYNTHKLLGAYSLYTLDKIVKGEIATGGATAVAGLGEEKEETEAELSAEYPSPEKITVTCPRCMQRQEMPQTEKTIPCKVCRTPILNPGL